VELGRVVDGDVGGGWERTGVVLKSCREKKGKRASDIIMIGDSIQTIIHLYSVLSEGQFLHMVQ